MESVTQLGIDLFGETLPSEADIARLSALVHSSERNRIVFEEQLSQTLSKGGQKGPSGEACRLAAGVALYILGRDSQALEKLEKAKDCKEKFIYLAYALRRLGRFEEAVEKLQQSCAYQADQLSVALEKAETWRKASNFAAAAKELKSCSNFENVSAEYHYQLGRLQEAQGLYEQATDNYKAALELSPSHDGALFHLAYRCDLSGDEEAAIDYYKQLVFRHPGGPTYVSALLNLAVLYEDIAEFEKASQCVDKVLKYHPNHPRAILFKKDIDSSKTMFYDEEKEKKKDFRTQLLETPLSDFELSVRSRNCFRRMNIATLGDLLRVTESDLLAYKNFGETSLREIKVILESRGLHLGIALEDKQFALSETVEGEPSADETKALLNKPVEDLGLSVRSRKCMQKLNIHTLADLVRKTEAELLGCKNFGVTSLNEVKKGLVNIGLSLRTLE